MAIDLCECCLAVLGVEYGGGDGKEAVEADGDQVEYWAGAADHIHGEIEITKLVWKVPVSPISLEL